jgi:alanyl-tRNA synthetase
LPDGRSGVILDRTYFYPTGGGQEHDTGTLGEARVVEVIKDETQTETVVIHVIVGDLPEGPISGKIDAERRLRHMQHHTAQHLLSQCFIRLFEIESISSNINGYTPSTLDLDVSSLPREQLDQIENLANRIISQNYPVRTYFVTPEQLQNIPIRKPPKVSENIRIVEIEGYDFTPCGGTHCTATGQIGMVKIIKAEKQGGLTRIYFVAGIQALLYFREYQETVLSIAGQMSIHPQEVLPSVQRLIEQLHIAQHEVQALRQVQLAFEARELGDASPTVGAWRVVIAAFENRPVPELRILADKLKTFPQTIAVLASYDGQKISLVITCAEDTRVAARDLITSILAPFGGRGGGDRQIAQGGGAVTVEQFRQIPDRILNIIKELAY